MRKEDTILDQRGGRCKQRPLTYDRFVVQHFAPVQGWQAVYHDDDEQHWTGPVHALALGFRRCFDAHTDREVRQAWRGPVQEDWEVLSLAYQPSDGWMITEEAQNWCGLLAPDMTLDDFERVSLCRLQHRAPRDVVPV